MNTEQQQCAQLADTAKRLEELQLALHGGEFNDYRPALCIAAALCVWASAGMSNEVFECRACGGAGLRYFGRSSEEPPCAECGGTGSAPIDLLTAARCAQNVLFLLQDEVKALGCNAKNVPQQLRAAIAIATKDQS